MNARQDTLVKRGRSYEKTALSNTVRTSVDEISFDQLDEQIRLRSQSGMYFSSLFLRGFQDMGKSCCSTELEMLTA